MNPELLRISERPNSDVLSATGVSLRRGQKRFRDNVLRSSVAHQRVPQTAVAIPLDYVSGQVLLKKLAALLLLNRNQLADMLLLLRQKLSLHVPNELPRLVALAAQAVGLLCEGALQRVLLREERGEGRAGLAFPSCKK